MRRKAIPALMFLLLLAFSGARAEAGEIGQVQKTGKTKYLLQPARVVAEPSILYIFFGGTTEMYGACHYYRELDADDGLLLIPQAEKSGKIALSSSWDPLLQDIHPLVREYMEQDYEIRIIGYSAGGYPATSLAVTLADEGWCGTLYLLDGIPKAFSGMETFSADYYRENLQDWQLVLYLSGKGSREISVRSREIAEEMKDDANVTAATFELRHEHLLDPLLETILHHAPEPARHAD